MRRDSQRMASRRAPRGQRTDRPTNLLNAAFMLAVHLGGVFPLAGCLVRPVVWPTMALGFVWYWCSGLSVTAGYHRLFAHRSYRCSWLVAVFYLLFGAAAVQNSALTWAADHRRHHAHPDTEDDPYDAKRGLWWSHIGWVLHDAPAGNYSNVRDLLDNPLVVSQHRYYPILALLMAAVVPALIALSWSDALGAFLWIGCVRLVVQYHSAFAVNSLAHYCGRRPYSTESSARDNVLVALMTMGEGYHNFHHRFPSDYRNGARWFHYDPTKWLIAGLAAVGLARGLKRTSTRAILNARVVSADSE